MPAFPTPPPIADALVAACEPLFALMENDPQHLAEGERLVLALLDAARALDLGALLLIRRLHGRLEQVKSKAAISALPLPPRAPRHA